MKLQMSHTNISEHTATIYFYKLQLFWMWVRVNPMRKNTKLRTRRAHVELSSKKKKVTASDRHPSKLYSTLPVSGILGVTM